MLSYSLAWIFVCWWSLPVQALRGIPSPGRVCHAPTKWTKNYSLLRLNANKLTAFVKWYDLTINRYPLTTKMVTGGVIGGIGDVLVQNIESQEKSLDLRRLYIFTMVSIVYFAPFIHFWFGFLESIHFPSHRSALYKATVMMLIDQIVGAIVLKSGFFYSFALVDQVTPPFKSKKRSFLQVANDLVKTKLWPTLKANW